MNKSKFATFIAGMALVALAVGCQTTTTNTNANANTNTAVVTNTNVNVNANANANTNANRRTTNANITREEYERNRAGYAEDARRFGRTIGSGANDGWLWVKARAALLAADDLRESTINVDVDNAVVTLTGTVANAAQKTKAGQVAKVEGVSRVVNNLTISASGGANANNANRNANNANGNAANANANRRP